MSYLLTFYAIKIFIFFLNLLPFTASSFTAKMVGRIFHLLAGSRRLVALDNLNHAYKETLSPAQKKVIARKSFENTALSILELFLTRKIKKSAARRFSISGLENMENALSKGKGAILITSHLGSWEYLGFLFQLTGIQCSPIVKSIKNIYLDKEIDNLRREMTLTPIPKKHAIRGTLTELKNNHVVAVLIDQWDGKEGLWIDFFGTLTATTSLPARLARKTGCALVPAYCLRNGSGKYEIQVLPQIPLPANHEKGWETTVSQQLNKMLEIHIRQNPDQWSWAHKRWKNKPETSRHT